MLADRVRIGSGGKSGDDISGSPGEKNLVVGTMEQGFFGEVPSSEFITGDALCSELGITEGTSKFINEPWLKFALDGKILFRPKKAIRSHISWEHINEKNCVYGDRIIEINGVKYKVRLMKGALTNPRDDSGGDKGAKGSEWNRLMLPIHIRAKDKSWKYPAYVEDNIPYWGIDYTDSDLRLSGSSNGRAVWCRERNEKSDIRVYRGEDGVSYSHGSIPSSTYSEYGFAPVLEVVK